MSLRAIAAATICVTTPTIAAAANPEEPGPYEVEVWADAPSPPVPLAMGVFHPVDAACAGAPLVLVHGAGESGAYKVTMAQLLASRGFVVVAPSFPNLLISPGQADADQINELLAWMIEQADDPTSPIAGKIDPTMQGVAGHSNGGVVFLAASDNPAVTAAVGWDAVAQLPAAAGLHGASLHLRAEIIGCNGGSSMGYDVAPAPKATAIVDSGSHCDFDDPESPFCVPVCGAPPWNDAAAKMIERYTVAFFECVLGHDPSAGTWVDFAMAQEGLSELQSEGTFQCRAACGEGGTSEGGGSEGADTSGGGGTTTSTTDGGEASASASASTTVASTSGASSESGSGGSSEGGANTSESGCGCDLQPSAIAPWSFALLLGIRRRRR
jgi:dienelactone hydrolase